jgi:hypothetical protein
MKRKKECDTNSPTDKCKENDRQDLRVRLVPADAAGQRWPPFRLAAATGCRRVRLVCRLHAIVTVGGTARGGSSWAMAVPPATRTSPAIVSGCRPVIFICVSILRWRQRITIVRRRWGGVSGTVDSDDTAETLWRTHQLPHVHCPPRLLTSLFPQGARVGPRLRTRPAGDTAQQRTRSAGGLAHLEIRPAAGTALRRTQPAGEAVRPRTRSATRCEGGAVKSHS